MLEDRRAVLALVPLKGRRGQTLQCGVSWHVEEIAEVRVVQGWVSKARDGIFFLTFSKTYTLSKCATNFSNFVSSFIKILVLREKICI